MPSARIRSSPKDDWLAATILVVRDRAIDRWMEFDPERVPTGAKRVYYLSLEFLIGRLLPTP